MLLTLIDIYMQNLNDALRWRYAVNQFDTEKKVAEEDLESILAAGNLMPTAYGLQPFRFVVISDSATKEALVPYSYGQRHVAENSHLIVLAARTDMDEAAINEYVSRIESVRGLTPGSVDGFKQMMVNDITNRTPEARLAWAQKQAYIALGGMMAAASLLKVDNHALEGFDPAGYNNVLGLEKENLHATVILALGYRSTDDAWQHYAKVRLPHETIVIARP
jgi:nitroreductase